MSEKLNDLSNSNFVVKGLGITESLIRTPHGKTLFISSSFKVKRKKEDDNFAFSSELMRKVTNTNRKTINADIAQRIDLLGEMQSLRNAYNRDNASSDFNKSACAENNERQAFPYNHQLLAECSSDIDATHYFNALKLLEVDPNIAYFLLACGRQSSLNKFCWPIKLNLKSPGMKQFHALRKEQFYHNIDEINGDDDLSLQKYELLENEVKSFVPKLSDNHLFWSENFQIIPKLKAFDRKLRSPAVPIKEMVKRKMHMLNDSRIVVKGPKPVNKDYLIKQATQHIDLTKLSFLHLPTPNMTLEEFKQVPVELLKDKKVRKRLCEDLVVAALGRHVEAMNDALIQSMFDFFEPFVEAVKDGRLEELIQNPTEHQSQQIKVSTEPQQLQVTHKASASANGSSDTAAAAGMEGGNEWTVKIQIRPSDQEEIAKKVATLEEENTQGDVSSNTTKYNRRKRKHEEIQKSGQLKNDELITWEHMLFAMQCFGDQLIAENRNSMEVHKDLPRLRITPEVLERVKLRLLSLFSKNEV